MAATRLPFELAAPELDCGTGRPNGPFSRVRSSLADLPAGGSHRISEAVFGSIFRFDGSTGPVTRSSQPATISWHLQQWTAYSTRPSIRHGFGCDCSAGAGR